MDTYQQFALRIGKRAGKIILSNFALGMKKQYKGDGSPVTKTDLAINNLLISEVKKQFPGHSVLAEEKSSFKQNSEYVWVCDPVDGTIPFSHGISVGTFSLALVRDGVPHLGVVVDPFNKRTFVARVGGGAYVNGKKIKVSKRKTLESSVVFVESWRDAQFDMMRLITEFTAQNALYLSLGSVVYEGSLVALGEAVCYMFPGWKSHDTAALKVIIEEAGGRVTDMRGNEQRYDQNIFGCIASNGILHETLVAMAKKYVLNK